MTRKTIAIKSPDDPEQSARFVETAKAVDANKNTSVFAIAFKKIVPGKIRNSKKRQRKPDA